MLEIVHFLMILELIPVKHGVNELKNLYIIAHYLNYILIYLASPSTDYFYSDKKNTIWFFLYTINYFFGLCLYARASISPGFQKTKKEQKNESDDRFYCETCEHHCQLRVSHCSICGGCVLRRDHHCTWLGTCVGQNNHLRFVCFLMIESITCISSTYLVIIGLYYRFRIGDNRYNGLMLLYLLPWGLFTTVFSIRLIFTQLRNILLNLTTWEMSRWDHITYLHGHIKGKSPFDKGVVNNIREFYSMANRKLVYARPRLFA